MHEYTQRHTTSAHTRLQFTHKLAYEYARAPTRRKHECVYAGNLLRKRNYMKRPHYIAPLVQQHPSTSQFRSITPFFNTCASACVRRADAGTNEQMTINADACVHTCASTHFDSLSTSTQCCTYAIVTGDAL